MDLYTSIVGFFQEGGPFMYPIAAVLAIGIAISLERSFYLARQMRVNRADFEKMLPLLKARKVKELASLSKQSSFWKAMSTQAQVRQNDEFSPLPMPALQCRSRRV